MKIFCLKITLDKNIFSNNVSGILLSCAVITFSVAMVCSDYFSSYRFKYSIVPAESSLVRFGPYMMSEVSSRSSILVEFKSNYGLKNYYEELYHFSDYKIVSDIIKKNNLNSVAYLWFCNCKTGRKVWKIEFNDKSLLSYEKSLLIYKRYSDPTFYLNFTLFILFFFLLSIFDVEYISLKSYLNKTKE